MKVYQLIYTTVKHSLSDSLLNLTNQPGLRVYSCSQGITKDNIGEIVKFSSYRLPKNNTTEYSETPGSPEVPELFPKCFRTMHLSDGRYAAIQIVYSGYDYEGQPGNFFAHAFVFDEFDDEFFPEQYFGSKFFKTYLTQAEFKAELVHYLPILKDIAPETDVENQVVDFISKHKKELSYLIDKSVKMLTSDDICNMCIASSEQNLIEMYLLSLKWLLPRDISMYTGISTYNIYIPSDKQGQIVFNGTIKGKNNITPQAIDARTTCVYIDMDTTDFSKVSESEIFSISIGELRDEYRKYDFNTVTQLGDWFETRRDITKPGIGAKLLNFKISAGDNAFRIRSEELYKHINDDNMSDVKFEISKIMYDNITLFTKTDVEITKAYIAQCFDILCRGEIYDIYDLFADGADKLHLAEKIKEQVPEYMKKIKDSRDVIGKKNTYILLILLAQIKNESGGGTWKEFFGNNKEFLTQFTEISSIIITGRGIHAFTPPSAWTKEDLDEMVVYFDSSTTDDRLKESCLKYIRINDDTDWEKYGIMFTSHKKTQGEQEQDMRRIKRMLKKVGYEPYQNGTYDSLKHDVSEDMHNGTSPLLLSRLLDAYYKWKCCYGNQIQSKNAAEKLKNLILEMRKTEKTCYDFVFPKLALEIIESNGHYHEMIINSETMTDSFWNWFVIGFEESDGSDDKIVNYTRIYEANKRRLLRIPEGRHVKAAFKSKEI